MKRPGRFGRAFFVGFVRPNASHSSLLFSQADPMRRCIMPGIRITGGWVLFYQPDYEENYDRDLIDADRAVLTRLGVGTQESSIEVENKWDDQAEWTLYHVSDGPISEVSFFVDYDIYLKLSIVNDPRISSNTPQISFMTEHDLERNGTVKWSNVQRHCYRQTPCIQ